MLLYWSFDACTSYPSTSCIRARCHSHPAAYSIFILNCPDSLHFCGLSHRLSAGTGFVQRAQASSAICFESFWSFAQLVAIGSKDAGP